MTQYSGLYPGSLRGCPQPQPSEAGTFLPVSMNERGNTEGKHMKLKTKKRLNRKVPMSAKTLNIMEQQLEKFRQKFGRHPGPEDPVFFDAAADMPQLIDQGKADEALLAAMTAAGLDPELMYAILKTGRFVTEENSALLSEEDLAEWHAAIEEYRKLQRTGKFN